MGKLILLKYLFISIVLLCLFSFIIYNLAYNLIDNPLERETGSSILLGFFLLGYFIVELFFFGIKVRTTIDKIKRKVWIILLIVHFGLFLYCVYFMKLFKIYF